MLLRLSCPLLVLCRTSCFIALKLHVLVVSFLFSGLQSIHMVTNSEHCKMRRDCFTLCYIRKPENMVIFVCIFCSELWFGQIFSGIPPHELHLVFNHIHVIR